MRFTPIPGPRGALAGLAVERTIMAWDRTALVLVGNAAVLALREPGRADPVRVLAAALAVVLALATTALGRLRARDWADCEQSLRAAPRVPACGLLAGGVLLLAGLELASICTA